MKFTVDGDQLTITLEGAEIFFGLQRHLRVKREDIVNLDWQPELRLDGRMWRVGGTDIPGVLYAGHFRGGGERYFLYLRQPRGGLTWTQTPMRLQNCLTITLRDSFNQHLLLSCSPDIGGSLLNWFKSV